MKNNKENFMLKLIRFFKVPLLVGVVVGGCIGVIEGNHDFIPIYFLDNIIVYGDWPPVFTSLIAFSYIVGGIFSAIASIYPQHGKRILGVRKEDIVSQRGLYVLQSVSAIALGLALGVLILANPLNYIGSTQAFVAFAILMVFGIYCFVKSWQKMDELLKAASNEAVTIAYYLVLTIGGGWAVLGHLGLAQGPEFLDWLTLFWTMILFATFYTSYRRGILEIKEL